MHAQVSGMFCPLPAAREVGHFKLPINTESFDYKALHMSEKKEESLRLKQGSSLL